MTTTLKQQVYDIIFEADTPTGKAFDVVLLVAIVISILALILESIDSFQHLYSGPLQTLEWIITILFTVEYVLRLWCIEKPLNYAKSFFGIIDLAAILPAYLGFLLSGVQFLLIIRVFRLLRVFRVLKMVRYVGEATILGNALKASFHKISIFLFVVVNIIIIVGTLMYLIEGSDSGFDNIPISMYWTIVTLTTVGYGDIAPATPLGQILASILMILGYGIIAVPTGIVTAEITRGSTPTKNSPELITCSNCLNEVSHSDAQYCFQCGVKIVK